MTAATAAPRIGDCTAMPAALVNACFVLFVVNVAGFLVLCVSHSWILDAHGRGIPTDFINVWSAGKLALDGHPALARDWDIQKQGVFGLVRFSGASEQLAWALQWAMTATVAVGTVLLWRSGARYSLKAAGLATATLLMTPYLFLYDMMVLAIPIAWPVRIGLADGFQKFELPALGCAALLLLCFPVFEAPIGLGGTLIVAAFIVRRLPAFRRKGPHAVDRTGVVAQS